MASAVLRKAPGRAILDTFLRPVEALEHVLESSQRTLLVPLEVLWIGPVDLFNHGFRYLWVICEQIPP